MCACAHTQMKMHRRHLKGFIAASYQALPAAGETVMSENGSLPSIISKLIDSGGTHIVCYENKIV